jgi:hypothetical protein
VDQACHDSDEANSDSGHGSIAAVFICTGGKNLIQGIMDFMFSFSRLEITLTRESRDVTVTRIKEDSLMLLQSVSNGQTVSFGSENWRVINEYVRD